MFWVQNGKNDKFYKIVSRILKIVHSELVSFFLGVEGESSNFLDVTELTCKKKFLVKVICALNC